MAQGGQEPEDLYLMIQEAIAEKEALQAKIAMAKIANKKITQNLERVRQERDHECSLRATLKQRIEDLARANEHASNSALKAKIELKQKRAQVADFKKFVGEQQSNFDSELSNARQQLAEFNAEVADSPWLPEKREMLQDLQKYENEHQQIKEKINECQNTINSQKELLGQHQKLSFKKFCITLATYYVKSNKMLHMVVTEKKRAKNLAEELKQLKNNDEQVFLEDSQIDENANADGDNGEVQMDNAESKDERPEKHVVIDEEEGEEQNEGNEAEGEEEMEEKQQSENEGEEEEEGLMEVDPVESAKGRANSANKEKSAANQPKQVNGIGGELGQQVANEPDGEDDGPNEEHHNFLQSSFFKNIPDTETGDADAANDDIFNIFGKPNAPHNSNGNSPYHFDFGFASQGNHEGQDNNNGFFPFAAAASPNNKDTSYSFF